MPFSGVGIGVGMGAVGVSEAAANANLLLWSEELDRAATWVPTAGATVTANQGQDELGSMTADRLELTSGSRVDQVTTIAAVAGSAAAVKIATSTRTRHSVTASIDGVNYVFSAYIEDPLDAGLQVQMFVGVVGGFIMCRWRDAGDEPSLLVSWCKLETPNLTAYVKREGT